MRNVLSNISQYFSSYQEIFQNLGRNFRNERRMQRLTSLSKILANRVRRSLNVEIDEKSNGKRYMISLSWLAGSYEGGKFNYFSPRLHSSFELYIRLNWLFRNFLNNPSLSSSFHMQILGDFSHLLSSQCLKVLKSESQLRVFCVGPGESWQTVVFIVVTCDNLPFPVYRCFP